MQRGPASFGWRARIAIKHRLRVDALRTWFKPRVARDEVDGAVTLAAYLKVPVASLLHLEGRSTSPRPVPTDSEMPCLSDLAFVLVERGLAEVGACVWYLGYVCEASMTGENAWCVCVSGR